MLLLLELFYCVKFFDFNDFVYTLVGYSVLSLSFLLALLRLPSLVCTYRLLHRNFILHFFEEGHQSLGISQLAAYLEVSLDLA